MPSILIAEDHSVVRIGVILLIKELYPDADITEAETFDEVIQHLTQRSFDLLLQDIHIPGGDDLSMIEAIKFRQPDIPILVFSSYDEQLYALRYLKAGVHGYLHKQSPPEEIKKAILQVMNKGRYVSKTAQDQLLTGMLDPKRKQQGDTGTLSGREMEVMHLLITGVRSSEIKTILKIHNSTISTYKAKIFQKMRVSNVIELAEKIKQQNAGGK